MRSVFYVVGLCYMLGLLVAVIVGTDLAFYFVALPSFLAVICAIFYKDKKKKELCTGLLCIAFGILAYSGCYSLLAMPVKQLEGSTAQLTATITEEPYSVNGRYYYSIKTKAVNIIDKQTATTPQSIRLKLSSAEDFKCNLYDDIKLEVEFKEVKKSPYYYHNISDGYYTNATVIKGSIKGLGSQTIMWDLFLNNIHNSIESKLSSVLNSESSGLLMALMLGNKATMNKAIQESFRQAGLSHIVVVSGLHLSIIAGFVFKLLSLFIKEKKITAGITIGIILLYVVFTGFTYSVIRCAVMNIIYLCSYFSMKKTDPFNSLGFAGLLITLINPLAIGNLGLIMSFSATLGIISVENKINGFILSRLPRAIKDKRLRLVNWLVKYIVSCASVSLSATLFTLPVMVFVFESFSTYFLLSNLLVTAVAPVTIILGIILTVLLYIPILSAIAEIIAVAENCLCCFIIWVSEFVSGLPVATIGLGSVTVKLATFIVIFIIAVLFIYQGFKIKNTGFCVAICSGVYIIVLVLGYIFMSTTFCLQIVDTGNGVTIIDYTANGINVLACGGDTYNSDNAFKAIEGKRVNLLIIPDYRKHYSKYAEDYICEFDIDNILLYDTDKYSDTLNELIKTENITYIDSNTRLNFNDYQYQIITADNKNWLYITSKNSSILVSPQNADCSQLPENYRECTVFILQRGCTDIDCIDSDNTIFCGKAKENDYYYTENGDVMIYEFLNRRANLWQS